MKTVIGQMNRPFVLYKNTLPMALAASPKYPAQRRLRD
jgi:hypothetical protein